MYYKNNYYLIGIVMLLTVVGYTDCCLSKQLPLSIDKPSPDTFINSNQCSPLYDLNYCLNGGRCFNYTIATYSIPYCECADGFLGERCEQKYLSISYGNMIMSSNTRSKRIHKAHIYFGPFLALITTICFGYLFYYYRFMVPPPSTHGLSSF